MMAQCGPFEQRPALAVAVSGGVDSMALLHLAHGWAQARGGKVTALTVNHQLRPEAADEAAQVGLWCKSLGIAHHVLAWQPPVLRNNIQEQARTGRYALLTQWCREQQVLHLFTAHSRDDQCETLFFRLARGSQLEGLAGMPLVTDLEGVRLVRPLLHHSKQELIAAMQGVGQSWLEDPSNKNSAYTRNYIRLQLANHDPDMQLSRQTEKLAGHFSNIRNALFLHNVSSLTNSVSLYPEGYAALNMAEFTVLTTEAARRLLAALIPALNGSYHPPRPAALQRLYQALCEGRKCSLAGLVFIPAKRQVWVTREMAVLPKALPLLNQHWKGLWDSRFRIFFENKASDKISDNVFSLRFLGKAGLDAAFEQIMPPSSMRILPALRALPSLWHLEELVCVPHMGYQNTKFDNICFEAMFCSVKPLAGSPFFGFNTYLANPLQER